MSVDVGVASSRIDKVMRPGGNIVAAVWEMRAATPHLPVTGGHTSCRRPSRSKNPKAVDRRLARRRPSGSARGALIWSFLSSLITATARRLRRSARAARQRTAPRVL